MVHLKLSIFGTSLFLLAGCANVFPQAYVQSTDKNSAKVSFVSKSGDFNLSVIHLPAQMQGCACTSGKVSTIGIFHNKAVLVAGSANYADKGRDTDRFEVRVPANGEEFRFAMFISDVQLNGMTVTSRGCQAHYGFNPQPNAEYIVTYDKTQAACDFHVVDVASGKPIDPTARKYPMCLVGQDDKGWFPNAVRDNCAKHPETYSTR
jgi:hypothetical protein